MGLAASQARFLNLTARKTNLEYEGQQINQQRTTLANQSANVYNQMLTLSIPTPPSETSFQTIQYTFSYAGNSYTINQVTGKNEKATVLATKTYVDNYCMTCGDSENPDKAVVTKRDGKYYVGTSQLKTINDPTADAGIAIASGDILAGMKVALDNNTITASNIYYVNVSSDEKNPVYKYFYSGDLQDRETFEARRFTAGSETKYSQEAFQNAQITRDANNRIVGIYSDKLGSNTISVTSITVKDQAAYDDAYNEYEYQTYLYEQKMNAINAQTSVIQAQDKKLELRLKQLDTEQNAIKTEMESVSSVVKKNVEDTFKIFA